MNGRRLVGPIAMVVVSLVISLVLAEVVLRVATPFPITELSNRLADPDFGYVVSDGVPDVDARGFRNRGVSLDDADVVVVGDSHTYGYNVDVAHAFPYVLGQLSGKRVYAMGVGGYGIYHYLALINALLQDPPSQVLLALYPANDLGSACSIVTSPKWQALGAQAGIEPPACEAPDMKTTSWLDGSALAGALHYVWLRFSGGTCGAPAIHFAAGPCLSIVRGEKHSRLTSLATAENRQRLNDAFSILKYANDRLLGAGVRFAVLIVPSRERVLLEWSRQFTAERDERLDVLVEPEIELARRFKEFLNAQQIPNRDATSDVVPAFASAVETGDAFYPAGDDGHPFAEGYAMYAAAAALLVDGTVTAIPRE